MENKSSAGESTLRHYLQVVRRRKWPIVIAVLLVPATAVFLSMRQEKLYQASSEVLVGTQNLASQLNGTPDANAYQPADRTLQTQADLATVPAVAARTLRAAGITGMTPQALLANSTVTPRTNSNLLVFDVTNHSPSVAQRLATEYARQFTNFRHQLDTVSIQRARNEVAARIQGLEAAK